MSKSFLRKYSPSFFYVFYLNHYIFQKRNSPTLSKYNLLWAITGDGRNFCLLCNLLIIDQCPAASGQFCARILQRVFLAQGRRDVYANQFYFTLMRGYHVSSFLLYNLLLLLLLLYLFFILLELN